MKIPATFQRKRARIEIIPLIDIIFFLLATFVMVSLSMVKNQGIMVNLPAAVTGQVLDRTVIKTVTVTKSGEVFLDKENLGLDGVSSRLAALKAREAELKVLVNGDDAADFGLVIKVLDEIRRLGISKVAIQTKGAQN